MIRIMVTSHLSTLRLDYDLTHAVCDSNGLIFFLKDTQKHMHLHATCAIIVGDSTVNLYIILGVLNSPRRQLDQLKTRRSPIFDLSFLRSLGGVFVFFSVY